MQPQNTNNQYEFIMNSGQKPKSGLSGLGLPRPVALGLGGVIILIVVIVVAALAFGGKAKSDNSVVALAAQAQEIVRVSGVVTQNTQDTSVTAIANTVSTILTSQEDQLNSYWTSTGHKTDTKALAADKNSDSDQQIKTAVQNNNLSATYSTYLKSSLNSYASALSGEYKTTASAKLKSVLNTAYQSVQTILASPNI